MVYSNYSKEVGNAYYGEGSGPIHYTYQYCIGTETSISQCLSSTSLSCGHHEDMGIKCGAGNAVIPCIRQLFNSPPSLHCTCR